MNIFKIVLLFAAILYFALLFGEERVESSVKVFVKSKMKIRSHIFNCRYGLAIENKHEAQMWYIVSNDNVCLNYDGYFEVSTNKTLSKYPFASLQFSENKKDVFMITYYGKKSLYLVLIPSKSTFYFDCFDQDSMVPNRLVDVFEAKTILVNGKTPLEKWLPVDILCSKDVSMSNQSVFKTPMEFENKEFKESKEKVTYLKADVNKRFLLSLSD